LDGPFLNPDDVEIVSGANRVTDFAVFQREDGLLDLLFEGAVASDKPEIAFGGF